MRVSKLAGFSITRIYFETANFIFSLANNLHRSNQAHSTIGLPFSNWASNSRNNTVDFVIDLIFILDWINKNLESIHEMEEIPGDALK